MSLHAVPAALTVERLAPLVADLADEACVPILTRAMVSLVRSGEITKENFVSPEAHQAFCVRHGIDPVGLKTELELSDAVAEVVVRLKFGEAALAEFGEPTPLVEQVMNEVIGAGGLRAVDVTSVVRDAVERSKLAGVDLPEGVRHG